MTRPWVGWVLAGVILTVMWLLWWALIAAFVAVCVR